MKVNLEERHGQLIPVSAEIENDKEVEFLLDQLRPKGEWTTDERGYFYCDKCKQHPYNQYAMTNFCPNCGADMRGGAE